MKANHLKSVLNPTNTKISAYWLKYTVPHLQCNIKANHVKSVLKVVLEANLRILVHISDST